MIIHKKSESQYISWIILLGLTVLLSYFLYTWSLNQAQQVSQQIEKTADPMVCNELGFAVDGICQRPNMLLFNVTNTNNVEITGFIVSEVGLYPDEGNYLDSRVVRYSVSTGDTEKVKMLTKMTLNHVEITPFTTKNNKDIYCEGQSVKKDQNDLGQC